MLLCNYYFFHFQKLLSKTHFWWYPCQLFINYIHNCLWQELNYLLNTCLWSTLIVTTFRLCVRMCFYGSVTNYWISSHVALYLSYTIRALPAGQDLMTFTADMTCRLGCFHVSAWPTHTHMTGGFVHSPMTLHIVGKRSNGAESLENKVELMRGHLGFATTLEVKENLLARKWQFACSQTRVL